MWVNTFTNISQHLFKKLNDFSGKIMFLTLPTINYNFSVEILEKTPVSSKYFFFINSAPIVEIYLIRFWYLRIFICHWEHKSIDSLIESCEGNLFDKLFGLDSSFVIRREKNFDDWVDLQVHSFEWRFILVEIIIRLAGIIN